MWAMLRESIDRWLGLSLQAHDLGFGHMAARALIVFCLAVALARLGDRRLLGRNASFDIMLGVILGSVLSRGINGQAAFFPSLGASVVLVVLHHIMATGAFYSRGFAWLVKGESRVVVRDGRVDREELRRNKITEDDLCENLRLNGNVRDPRDVAEARLEQNGRISVVKKE